MGTRIGPVHPTRDTIPTRPTGDHPMTYVVRPETHSTDPTVEELKGWTFLRKGQSQAGEWDGAAAMKAFAEAMDMADPEMKSKMAKIKARETEAGVKTDSSKSDD